MVFINKFARFLSPGIHQTRILPATCNSLTRWYKIVLFRLFNIEVGTLTFFNPEFLSQKMLVRTYNGTPKHWSLYFKSSTNSLATLNVKNRNQKNKITLYSAS